MGNDMSLVMIIATRMEAEPFLTGLKVEEVEAKPFQVYLGNGVCILISGIGKVNAGMATGYACLKFNPEWVLNVGAAGATVDSETLGRVYNINKTVEPDRIHLRTNSPYVQFPDSLDGLMS